MARKKKKNVKTNNMVVVDSNLLGKFEGMFHLKQGDLKHIGGIAIDKKLFSPCGDVNISCIDITHVGDSIVEAFYDIYVDGKIAARNVRLEDVSIIQNKQRLFQAKIHDFKAFNLGILKSNVVKQRVNGKLEYVYNKKLSLEDTAILEDEFLDNEGLIKGHVLSTRNVEDVLFTTLVDVYKDEKLVAENVAIANTNIRINVVENHKIKVPNSTSKEFTIRGTNTKSDFDLLLETIK